MNHQHKPQTLRLLALTTLSLLLFLFLVPSPARAEDNLSIESELLRPGVRLLAVEFYASWCKPCMDAVPRWKALHETYRAKGLRFIVVAVQDDGRCVNPGWNPDRMVCDEDGRISQAFRVGQNLPAAFLWSWTGKLLVQRGHVDAVQRAIETELAQLPRVTVGAATAGPDAATLAKVVDLLKSELSRSGKLDVVASVDEQKLLDQLRRESQKAGYAENTTCKLGEQIAANTLLKASLQRSGKAPKLLLQLFSAEKGCLTASGLAPFAANNAERATAEAVADLMQHLRQETQMPAAAESKPKQPFGGRKVEDAKTVEADEVAEAVIDFASTPRSAVFVGDRMVCEKTPCSQSVGHGSVSITMSAKDYVTRTETVSVGPTTRRIDWTLDEDFARLDADCGGKALSIKLDGKPLGNCPLSKVVIATGRHRVEIADPCYLAVKEEFDVKRGETKAIAVAPVAKMAALTIKAKDSDGNALRGTARLDGRELGAVPGGYKVPACSKRLVVNSEANGDWATDLQLAEGEKKLVEAGFKALPESAVAEEPERPRPAPPTKPAVATPVPARPSAAPDVSVHAAETPSRAVPVAVLTLSALSGLGAAVLGGTAAADRSALQTSIDSAKTTGVWPTSTSYSDAQAQVTALNQRIYAAWALGVAAGVGTVVGYLLWPTTPELAHVTVAPWQAGTGIQVGWSW